MARLRLIAAALAAVATGSLLLAGAHAAGAMSPTRLADDRLTPFSSVGRLDIEYQGDRSSCTATLVGDNRTLITAAHCVQPGVRRLTFHLGNGGPGVEATIVARGELPTPTVERDFDAAAPEAGEDKAPSPYWDDWLVLDLAEPAPGAPLETASGALTARLQAGAYAGTPFRVAGFPINVDSGRRMVWVQGAGIPGFPEHGWRGAHSVVTQARAYEGMSGGAVLLNEGGRDVVVGVVSGGDGDETLIVVGGEAFDSVARKRAADCRERAAGLVFSTPCGPPRGASAQAL